MKSKTLFLLLFIQLCFGYKIQGLKEQFSIIIENKPQGKILIESKTTINQIGEVIIPVKKLNKEKSFTAAKWGDISSVVAVAVNAIHIKTGHNQDNDSAIIFSILPVEHNKQEDQRSYYDQSSSIVTNINSGMEIFGGKFSPLVNNLVFLKKDNLLHLIDNNYQPQEGDIFIIKVFFPEPYPTQIVFENKFDGDISIYYQNGEKEHVGKVLKPVLGIGRFMGTKYSDSSRIRANHKAVIDISTSPYGKVGGFQIIPSEHAESKEMIAAKTKTQWMVVSSDNDYPFELFSGFVICKYYHSDINSQNWANQISDRTLVQCKKNNSTKWQSFPIIYVDPQKPLPQQMNTVLKDLTHIRILSPIISN